MNLANNIKKLRKKRGMTQTDLARRLTLAGKSTVSKYEDGRAEPKINGLVKMKRIFRVSIDELILKRF